MKLLTHIPSWLKNKYLLTGVFFIMWMLFFDPKDLFSDFERRNKLDDLQKSEQHLKKTPVSRYLFLSQDGIWVRSFMRVIC